MYTKAISYNYTCKYIYICTYTAQRYITNKNNTHVVQCYIHYTANHYHMYIHTKPKQWRKHVSSYTHLCIHVYIYILKTYIYIYVMSMHLEYLYYMYKYVSLGHPAPPNGLGPSKRKWPPMRGTFISNPQPWNCRPRTIGDFLIYLLCISLSICIHIYVYIYIYICVYIHI